MGKAFVVAGSLFAVLLLIGIFAPSPEDSDDPVVEVLDDAEASSELDSTEPSTTDKVTTEEQPEAPPPLPRVARIIDGDTLELDDGRRVRLVQIDAPEADGECYARKSTAAHRRLLPTGAEVRLVRDRGLDGRDRFGRLLRYVFKGKQHVNLALVQRGAASAWFYRGDRGRYATRLERAADRARTRERGGWGACEASTDYLRAWTTTNEPQPPTHSCHPSYTGACLDPAASDYDCQGGEGDGPKYTGFVRVVGPDDFDLDRDGDGLACEAS